MYRRSRNVCTDDDDVDDKLHRSPSNLSVHGSVDNRMKRSIIETDYFSSTPSPHHQYDCRQMKL